jgi:hypothetical protein
MRALANPAPEAPADPGRKIWAASGLLVAATLIIGTVLLLAPSPDSPPPNEFAQPQSVQIQGIPAPGAQVQATTTRIVTVPQPVTSLTVLSYGAPVDVIGGTASNVQVTETLSYHGSPPAVTQSVDGGHLLLADPVCSLSAPSAAGCSVSFTVIVPAGLRVTVVTDGGPARLTFTQPPASVSVSTDGGPATVSAPGGPYALTADSGGGPEVIAVATDPSAPRSLTISTAGGPLQVTP